MRNQAIFDAWFSFVRRRALRAGGNRAQMRLAVSRVLDAVGFEPDVLNSIALELLRVAAREDSDNLSRIAALLARDVAKNAKEK